MFRFCKTFEEKKNLFRKLSKFLHPDSGGDHDLMRILLETWKEIEEDHIKSNTDEMEKSEKIFAQDERFIFAQRMMNEIARYALNVNKKFNMTFISSVFEKSEKDNFITVCQFRAVLNVYEKFDVKNALDLWDDTENTKEESS